MRSLSTKIMQGMALATLLIGCNTWAADDAKPATKKPAAAAKQETKTPATKEPAAKTNGQHANDQLTLDATVVTGNRELPKVMYIVPWKKADLSNLPGQPFNTLIDEALAPVDREVFRREVAYYDVVSDKDHAGAKTSTGEATSGTDKK